VSSHRGPDLPYSVVAGVTPFNDKWLVASAKIAGSTFAPEPPKAYDAFLEVLSERPQFEVIVVNVPIGFLDTPEMGPRTCDRQARALLKRRGTSVHNAPSRAVFEGRVEPDKDGLDAVTRTMLPRYREVAAEMSPYRQRVVYEGSSRTELLPTAQGHAAQEVEGDHRGQRGTSYRPRRADPRQ
jgi:hypothetical protein